MKSQLDTVKDRIYVNSRDSLISGNIALDKEEKSIITQIGEIERIHPDVYKYILDLIIKKHKYDTERNKEDSLNTTWNKDLVHAFFVEYEHIKFSDGYFYQDANKLRTKFDKFPINDRPALLSNIKKLDMRLFHLLQLIIRKQETRKDYIEFMHILYNNRIYGQ